jgi:hypothetical protein
MGSTIASESEIALEGREKKDTTVTNIIQQ